LWEQLLLVRRQRRWQHELVRRSGRRIHDVVFLFLIRFLVVGEHEHLEQLLGRPRGVS
jgi:hypothetical protein